MILEFLLVEVIQIVGAIAGGWGSLRVYRDDIVTAILLVTFSVCCILLASIGILKKLL